MFIITVVPLRRGIMSPTLSYFSSSAYAPGTLISIPVRTSTFMGLVTQSEEVSAAKTALRAATFSLRKLPPQSHTSTLSRTLVQTAEQLCEHYACSLGLVLYTILPPVIRTGEIALPHVFETDTQVGGSTTHTPHVLQAKHDERMLAYRSLVRETFAHCGSVLIVVPTSIDADTLRHSLESGISDRIVMLTSASTKTELRKAYADLADFTKVKLIITTPHYSVIERHDITVVVVEQARSPYFRDLTRPFLDYRDVIKIHAKRTGRKLIFGDILPRTEEESLRRDDIYGTLGETPKRIELPGKLERITMARDTTPQSFALFSPQTIEAIADTRKKKGRVFIFAARRGLAPLVSCADCGHIFRSKESGAPYSLVRTVKNDVEERWFVCGTTGERVRAFETCTVCGSWRLKERGIGVQHVSDELHKHFPHTPIILFDQSTARTYKKAVMLRDTFYTTKGALMLGTTMAIPYLTEPVDVSVITSMDALLATPTWRLEEENLALLLSLREKTNGTLYVQTRTEHEGLMHAKLGTVEQFYTEELELRKAFAYPPFSTFIHFTWQGTLQEVKQREVEIRALFGEDAISIYQNPYMQTENPMYYGLIRIEARTWPHKKLREKILALHPSVRMVINPDRIV